jgi:hypothetical protein
MLGVVVVFPPPFFLSHRTFEHDSVRRKMDAKHQTGATGRRGTPAPAVSLQLRTRLYRGGVPAQTPTRAAALRCLATKIPQKVAARSRSGGAHGLWSRHRFQSLGSAGCPAGCSNQGCSTGQRGSFLFHSALALDRLASPLSEHTANEACRRHEVRISFVCDGRVYSCVAENGLSLQLLDHLEWQSTRTFHG